MQAQEPDINVGVRQLEFPADINTTGLPEFTESLSIFINSEERINTVLSGSIDLLAKNIKSAICQMRAKLNAILIADGEQQTGISAEAAKEI